MSARYSVKPGSRFPTGATATATGVNFSIFSRHATRVWLRLYSAATDHEPLLEIELDAEFNQTFFFWHVFVEGAAAGLFYTWRVDGPHEPAAGLRFDSRRELVDPWARMVSDALWRRDSSRFGDGGAAIRGRVAPPDSYDWEGDAPLGRPLQDSIIYELHARGFTQHASSRVQHRGRFRGVVEKISHLKSLGVTDIELLPIAAFDPQDVPVSVAQRGLTNYWGYSPYGFFAPHAGYAGADPRTEFRDMVKALHRAGIGVILDMVLNHTAEGGEDGVVMSFKGLGNEFFYHLDADDKSKYRDFTGCGNTINCNHPLVARFLLQCLEFWVRDMHVDGFRLDLASVLSRGEDGEPMQHAPVLWSIEFSSALESTHLIAEAWDAAGLHQVGEFPGFRWSEWNGRYRDSMRRFVRGEPGLLGEIATRIAGSSDLYTNSGKGPTNSINFVTCHDGFTLYDLVSYEHKRNEPNGEDNRDGSDENYSSNCGVEGPTDDLEINRLRAQRSRNLIALLLLSQGVPMLLAGDEMQRTQRGNNNAYCQDNEISWIDWSLDEAAQAMLRFTREMIALRKRHASLRRTRFLNASSAQGEAEISWYGERADPPNWDDPQANVLCMTLAGVAPGEPALHIMINMSTEVKALPLPPDSHRWQRLVDTSLAPPYDVVSLHDAVPERAREYRLAAQGIAVFEAL